MAESNAPRYLTKSLFNLANECPTKLAYVGKKEYGNSSADSPFLKALAEGGFQVGELAKLYFPGGILVETLEYDKAIALTNKLLNEEEVIIYEAAIRYENLFARVDVLKKSGNKISLYEVKAKSFDSENDRFYQKTKEKKLLSEWEPYLLDIAFQSYIAQRALQGHTLTSYLCLVDKNVESSINGLNQNFLLNRTSAGRISAQTKIKFAPEQLGLKLLKEIQVNEEIRFIRAMTYFGKSFEDWIEDLSNSYRNEIKIEPTLGKKCRDCEFRTKTEQKAAGLKSGFEECWKKVVGRNSEEPLVLELWNNRSTEKFITEKMYFLKDIPKEMINPKPNEDKDGLSHSERQWLQIEKQTNKDVSPFLDLTGLKTKFAQWRYPLHFIDFETSTTALPFNKGRRPYEQIAFQFSHHIVHEDGSVVHAGQFISRKRGQFPNFDFIQALKAELDKDQGTIFRYAAHENSVLCQIHDQIKASELSESVKESLTTWIRTITKKRDPVTKEILWEGQRLMVDLREVVLSHYYNPATHGSNSLKYVLPATLNSSTYLKQKYALPIYGAAGGIPSKNFVDKTWVHLDKNGSIIDPYQSLDPIFSALDDQEIKHLYPDTEIKDGGAAMMAYARLQFTEISETEAERIVQALLRYCELDTFAMVLLFEYWKSELNR